MHVPDCAGLMSSKSTGHHSLQKVQRKITKEMLRMLAPGEEASALNSSPGGHKSCGTGIVEQGAGSYP